MIHNAARAARRVQANHSVTPTSLSYRLALGLENAACRLAREFRFVDVLYCLPRR